MKKSILTKRLVIRAGLIAMGYFTFFVNPTQAQCDADEFVNDCASGLGGEYGYLQTFDAEEFEGSTNYPYSGAYLFRKGINYIFILCEKSVADTQIIVNLYNRTRKLVASTHPEGSERYYDKMIFKCNATGIFFVQTLMPLGEDNCGITMLGFDAQ